MVAEQDGAASIYRSRSGHCADIVNRSKMTHTADLLRGFGAAQHGKRAAFSNLNVPVVQAARAESVERITHIGRPPFPV